MHHLEMRKLGYLSPSSHIPGYSHVSTNMNVSSFIYIDQNPIAYTGLHKRECKAQAPSCCSFSRSLLQSWACVSLWNQLHSQEHNLLHFTEQQTGTKGYANFPFSSINQKRDLGQSLQMWV